MKEFFSATLLMTGLLIPASQASEIDTRRVSQQQRIAQGVHSGSLRPWETARLEREEGAINREIARDRFYNGGSLTPGERCRINHQLDRISGQIYRYKHNGF
jgi:hypothetical protein